jgi:hypothetical protein
MSSHHSVVSIPGHHLDWVPELLADLAYKIQGPEKVVAFELLDETMDAIERVPKRLAKVAFVSKEATHIVDPELVIWCDDMVLPAFSKKHQCRIFGWIAVLDPPTYGFYLFEAGKTVREVLYASSVLTQSGPALHEEDGMNWQKITDRSFESFITRMNSVFDLPETETEYHVWAVLE